MGAKRRTEEEHSAGGVVFRRLPDGVHVLLIRDPYDNWGLPKGHREGDEEPHETALREVLEETGLTCRVVGDELATIDWYFRRDDYVVHKTAQFFLMEHVGGEATPELAEGITECRWFPAEDAVTSVTYDNAREVLKEARRVLGLDAPDSEP